MTTNPVASTPDGDGEIKSLLRNYNLTSLEVDVYIGLLKEGKSRAKAISDHLGINRVEVYRVLKRLTTRGLVSTTESGPTTYEAIEPTMAVKVLIREEESKVRKLRELAPELLLQFETIQRNTKINSISDPLTVFKLLRGEAAGEALKETVAGAKEEILGVWSLRRMYSYGMIDSFLDALKRGVHAKIICEITKNNLPEAEELSALTDLRHLPGIERSLRFTIVDTKVLVLGVATVDSSVNSHINVFSTNRDLIQLITRQFEILWKDSVRPGKNFLKAEARHQERM